MGLSTYAKTSFYDAIGNNTSFAVAQAYILLHTGDPGSAGTANVAGNATLKSVSFGAASSGAISNDADIAWSEAEVDATEDYTYFSLWDGPDGPGTDNCLFTGTVDANSVNASGDGFTIASGDLDLS